MSALHGKGEVLKVADKLGEGPIELHHTKSPMGGQRRACDATVIPLRKSDHELLEMNPKEERLLQRAISTWASFSFWCWHQGLSGDPDDALAFNKWVLEKLEQEELCRNG